MKLRFIAIVAAILLVQVGLMALVWNSPSLKAERALPPRPSHTPPYPTPAATATRIATLIPVSSSGLSQQVSQGSYNTGQCSIAALDLLGAWVKAGKPATAGFDFQDASGKACQATFPADVAPLFNQPNIWFGGAIGCTTCHGPDVKTATAGLSLTSLEAILAGSRRTDATAAGQDILGDASTWDKSKLYVMIFNRVMPVGRPADSPQKGPVIKVGTVKP